MTFAALTLVVPVNLPAESLTALPCAPDCRGVELVGATLTNLNLNGVLVNADLTDATLSGVSRSVNSGGRHQCGDLITWSMPRRRSAILNERAIEVMVGHVRGCDDSRRLPGCFLME